MNEIVQMVSQKFNIPPETAQQIVAFIAEQLKGRLPVGLSSHLDSLMAGGAGAEAGGESGSSLMDSVKNMASGMVRKA